MGRLATSIMGYGKGSHGVHSKYNNSLQSWNGLWTFNSPFEFEALHTWPVVGTEWAFTKARISNFGCRLSKNEARLQIILKNQRIPISIAHRTNMETSTSACCQNHQPSEFGEAALQIVHIADYGIETKLGKNEKLHKINDISCSKNHPSWCLFLCVSSVDEFL